MTTPHVALVHDFLTQRGGAERVVLQLARMFPLAPVHTSIFEESGTYVEFGELDVRTSRLQGRVRPDRFRLAALRYPGAFREMALDDFPMVLCSSSAFSHHVAHPNKFVYCHTPPRFLYSSGAYNRFGTLSGAARPVLDRLRAQDCAAAWTATSYAANSRATADHIASVYGISATVIHPPLGTAHLGDTVEALPERPRALMVARLQPYKRVDLAIRGCQAAGIPLTIVGDGPEAARLRAIADDSVVFLGRVDDARMPDLFASHSMVLAPGREDFGYAPIEGNFAGRPAVARAVGGFLETVIDGETGILVDTDDVADWAVAIRSAAERSWSPESLRASTAPYRFPAFAAAVRSWLGQAADTFSIPSVPHQTAVAQSPVVFSD